MLDTSERALDSGWNQCAAISDRARIKVGHRLIAIHREASSRFDANREAFQSGSRMWFTEYKRSGLDGGRVVDLERGEVLIGE